MKPNLPRMCLMQNAGQQFGQGGAPSHRSALFGHSESTTNSGSITSSLRQFRRKNEDKQPLQDTPTTVAESHVARVPPHNHYPARQPTEYRFQQQYQDYNSTPGKFPEVIDPNQSLRDHISSSVIQKTKDKEYMEMCNVQQPHMKQSFDHLNGQPSYPESNVHPHIPSHAQYIPKEAQVHPAYKSESQYFHKDTQYQQLPHQMQKYNMPAQVRKFPQGNDFLSKLRRIHPTMARSIMSDHHLQESQTPYQPMDQTRIYSPQHQRYMNYPSMPNNPYPPGYMSSQSYPNYPASCSYNRSSQMGQRFSSINSQERSISPRRSYTESMAMNMNYGAMPSQKVSPNYSHYAAPEYAQHYQHRRAPIGQDYYQQQCRPSQYLPHQMAPQDISENRVTVSDSIKQYIENWADEDTASELESNRLCKDGMRVRDDPSTGTVFMISQSELQYFENGVPIVTSESTIPMVTPENCQYIIKSGVSIDNTSGTVRLVDNKNDHIIDLGDNNEERVVNLHIMDSLKQDCLLANKPNESNQRQTTNEHLYENMTGKPRVVIHQNTVIQSGYQNVSTDNSFGNITNEQVKVGNSLPIITDTIEEELNQSIKEYKKITVDKNCSPITLDQLEEYKESSLQSSVICSNKNVEDEFVKEIHNIQECNTEPSTKDVPFFDEFSVSINSKVEGENRITIKSDRSKLVNPKEELTVQPHISVPETSINTEYSDELSQIEKQNDNDELLNSDNICSFTDGSRDIICEEKRSAEKCSASVCEEQREPVNSDDSSLSVLGKEAVIDEIMEVEVKTFTEDGELTVKNTDIKNILPVSNENPDKSENNVLNGNKEGKIFTKQFDTVIEKSKNKRSKRIFSVDDIINNIGKNLKSNSEKDVLERRHSLHSTKEFLDREIANTLFVPEFEKKHTLIEIGKQNLSEQLPKVEMNGYKLKETEPAFLEKMATEKSSEEVDLKYEFVVPDKTKPDVDEKKTCGDLVSEDGIEGKKYFANDENRKSNSQNCDELLRIEEVDTSHKEILVNTSKTIRPNSNIFESFNELKNSQFLMKKYIDTNENKVLETSSNTVETSSQTCFQDDRDIIIDDSINQTVDSIQEASVQLIEQKKVNSGSDQSEVQYRSVIKVEESCVLLQIAGELVEVNVNIVNGKNVITVVPLSDTAILDLNENYETVINPETIDPLHIDDIIMESNDGLTETVEYQTDKPEIIETTSEIIIGMDLSLEEEIQLDLAQPPMMCTKASKKAYDSDLQIPSITTSEDIHDNNKLEVFLNNDKVSSSKEHVNRNKKHERLIDSSKKQKYQRSIDSTDKKISQNKSRNQIKSKQRKTPEEDEFVPFKDLILARKLKKLKQQKNKNNEDGTVDSTMKTDDLSKDTTELTKMDIVKKGESEEETPSVKEEIRKSPKKLLSSEINFKFIEKEKFSEINDQNKVMCCQTLDGNRGAIEKQIEKAASCKKVFDNEDKTTKGSSNSKEVTPKEITNYKLEDPRLKSRSNSCSSKYSDGKRKLSLEEYNKRKRKLSGSMEVKSEIEAEMTPSERNNSKNESSLNISSVRVVPEKIQFQRPKSLDDLNSLKAKESKSIKRKLSLQSSPVKQNYFDWEETQSPKFNFYQNNLDKKFCEFSGLIGDNGKDKSKNETQRKSNCEARGDEILQNYKEQVDFKLSSLKFEIPRVVKPVEQAPRNPFSKSESCSLMQRFLKDEKLTSEEMEKICKIISYKRMVQKLKNTKFSEPPVSEENLTYEVHKESGDRNTKLHLKKVSERKRKNRFRNLHCRSNSEDEISDNKKSDYSVVQSDCLAGVVPKLIIKRKTEMPLPVVRLERLDLGLLANKRVRYVI
ncbi:uncharacterized protein isoform X2 [Leptinotarsa decemlineata]|uniref:uncharacterized protein isoform X2 n=1 Tax=Leptinotarsa decemlineata TaxID=7539 RepID=UPI003D307EAF